MKILIAEDDDNSKHLLEIVLSNAGYEVVSFENGLKALAFLQTNHVDLIISDILMPEMDGYGLCRELKQNQYLQKIPFIFYTATYTSSQDERFAMTLGATRFLIKPIAMDELLTIIASVIKADDSPTKQVNGSLSNFSPLRLDKQHADIMRNKLSKKIIELNEEKQKLLASEARFRDFAEASADWFWETDAQLKIYALTGRLAELGFENLFELAKTCQNHLPEDMIKQIESHQRLSDFVLSFNDSSDKLIQLSISGKPIFNDENLFTGYRGIAREVSL